MVRFEGGLNGGGRIGRAFCRLKFLELDFFKNTNLKEGYIMISFKNKTIGEG